MARHEIAILGAGLCGLVLGAELHAQGRDVIVLEARDRPGGRVLTQRGYDLGPAWVWPQNRRILKLAERYGLGFFPQHSAGRLVFEDATGGIRRDLGFATMGGALRMQGGLARLIDCLVGDLEGRLRLNCRIHSVSAAVRGVTLTSEDEVIEAERAVLALPPRLAQRLGLSVPDAPTWMAGHAKLIAVYDAPFWREDGLNGDAISHIGPLAEIHDATLFDSRSEGALFGFALPGAARAPDFEANALAQLARLFGPEMGHPREVFVKDWSRDVMTATEADFVPPQTHPAYRPIAAQGSILFAGTETACADGGFLEGALEAAETALNALDRLIGAASTR
jgi:monoamine oxidase